MLASSVPTKFAIPFGNNAVPTNIQQVPQASQIGITAGAASLVDGFPPLTFVPVGAGGIPPWGRDFNGLFNQETAWTRFASCAGGLPLFDSAFSSAVGGYPQGAVIAAISGVTAGSPQGGTHLWLSTADNNTVNPDTTFNTTNWTPIPAVIDAPVTYTVHGASPQFADLNVAMSYLRKFRITDNGKVTLQLAGAPSGTAQSFTYNKSVVFDHPQNYCIFVLGATMLGTVPSTFAGYTLTGNSSGQRASDSAANLTLLRTKFATEIHLISGASFEITGNTLGSIDGLLFTTDGNSLMALAISAANNELGFVFTGSGTRGIAIVGSFITASLYVGTSGTNATNGGIGYPLVVLGGGGALGGIVANAGGRFQPGGVCLSFSNGNSGFASENSSWIFFDTTGCESFYNAGHGMLSQNQSNFYAVGSVSWGNAGWGYLAQYGSLIEADGSNTVGAANGSGDAAAGSGSFVSVTGITSGGVFSPTLNTVGNFNAMVGAP